MKDAVHSCKTFCSRCGGTYNLEDLHETEEYLKLLCDLCYANKIFIKVAVKLGSKTQDIWSIK